MRADRLLSILLLLQVNRRMTARELAERLEVSERTVLRDMEALGAAGVPVTADRGTGGGWRLVRDYRTDLTGLSAAELQTLFLARSTRLLSDLGLGQAADSALIKLTAALPAVSRQDIDRLRERLHIDGAGWYQSAEACPFLKILQDAVWQERRVRLLYKRSDDKVVEREVDPLGLIAKGGIWYLAARSDGDLRSYRISRVQDAEILDGPAERPPDFDLAAFWEQSVAHLKANVPQYPAVLRVSPDQLARMRRSWFPRIAREEPAGDGWIVLHVTFEVEEEACDYVLRAAGRVEALEPSSLRARVCETAERIAGMHAEAPTPTPPGTPWVWRGFQKDVIDCVS